MISFTDDELERVFKSAEPKEELARIIRHKAVAIYTEERE